MKEEGVPVEIMGGERLKESIKGTPSEIKVLKKEELYHQKVYKEKQINFTYG